MNLSLWEQCLNSLESEFPSQQFNTWIRPLQAEHLDGKLILLAPNRFVLDWISERFLFRINELVKQFGGHTPPNVLLEIGSKGSNNKSSSLAKSATTTATVQTKAASTHTDLVYQSNLNLNFTFDNFVEGKSNQLAKAACLQVSENPAAAYNPLFLYGGVGLGKTHLMHAIGNQIIRNNARALLRII